MADRSRCQNLFWHVAQQVLDHVQFVVQTEFHRSQRSHLTIWLFGAALSAACGDGNALQTVSVRATSDTEDAAVADAEAPSTAPTLHACRVDATFLGARKACTRDAECEAVSYRPDCCGTKVVAGVAIESADEVRACAEEAPPICSVCGVKPTRAEDGRSVVGDDVVARCVSRQCRSVVESRRCGSALRCNAGELCVASENVRGGTSSGDHTGDNALISYACVPNPCQHAIDCSCAQPACDLRSDAIRQCHIEFSEDADVTCVPVAN